MKSRIGRGDLLRALRNGEDARQDRTASLLGFARSKKKRPRTQFPAFYEDTNVSPPALTFAPRALDPVPLLVPMRFVLTGQAQTPEMPKELHLAPVAAGEALDPHAAIPWYPLAGWRTLRPLLDDLLREARGSLSIDLASATRRLAEARLLSPIPLQERKTAPRTLAVIRDLSDHLTPYFRDQAIVLGLLRRILPATRVVSFAYVEASGDIRCREEGAPRALQAEAVDGPVLVLGDLGSLASDDRTRLWCDLGRRLGRGRARALSPLCPAAMPSQLTEYWRVAEWADTTCDPQRTADARQKHAATLLALLGGAERVEPGLLRAVRLKALPEADAAVEALAWESRDFLARFADVAVPDPSAVARRRTAFQQADPARAAKALSAQRPWRTALAAEVWFMEMLELPPHLRDQVPVEDLARMRDYLARLTAQVHRGEIDKLPPKLLDWIRRVGRNGVRALEDPDMRTAVLAVERLDRGLGAQPKAAPSSVGCIFVSQHGECLRANADAPPLGSPIAILPSDSGKIELFEVTLPEAPWAKVKGLDRYGAFADIDVFGQPIRLRFCPPGRFKMGSPETEEGRWRDEGPQVDIAFDAGFWLMETAVTQALWEAVIGDNPSRFKGDDLPVESVSWNDTQDFLGRINARHPDLALRLPSEAEWEYACRAGTTSAYAFGDPAGIHFEASKTVPVADRPPNGWGLYQMHGNVDEWCTDSWSESHEGADPTGRPRPASKQEDRVIRGGSWTVYARDVRSAYRGRSAPTLRHVALGLRLARGQMSFGTGAERHAAGTWAAGAPLEETYVLPGRTGRLKAPAHPFVLRTDRAELVLERQSNQDLAWAEAAGRDRFGLWTRLAIGDHDIQLRWCPPGRFTMGSPTDEPGRFDDEGPLTDVTFGAGFWMMATPVTQAVWTAVMGANPSRFQTSDRPVERVSWDDCQSFVTRLEELRPSLGLRLPSEAAWEYACRAGTTAATYAGPIEILGANNAPILNEIAWYGGNSGVGFDLEDGHDSSDWPGKAFDHAKASSRPVAQKRPNPWGLFDMLGNVWEWCADAWSGSHEGADPTGRPRPASKREGGARVIRGGSRNANARNVRSAYRNRSAPDHRNDNLGLRLARGQFIVSEEGAERPGSSAAPSGEAEPLS